MTEAEINAMLAALTEQRNEALNVAARLRAALTVRDARIAELEATLRKSAEKIAPPLDDHFEEPNGAGN